MIYDLRSSFILAAAYTSGAHSLSTLNHLTLTYRAALRTRVFSKSMSRDYVRRVAIASAATLGAAVFANFTLKLVNNVVQGCRVFFSPSAVDIKQRFGNWAGMFLRNQNMYCSLYDIDPFAGKTVLL
jgi:hypothetical protein